jgi:SAM-dependent methyltransferase
VLRDVEWWRHRGAGGCLCCGSKQLESDPTLTSLFLSRTAWHGRPEPTWLHRCAECDFRFYDRGLSDAEAASYYAAYRTADYLRNRHADEPFYTRKLHAGIDQFLHSPVRRDSLQQALERACVSPPFDAVLDYGGSDGTLISGLQARRKAVFDIGGSVPAPDIEFIRAGDLREEWDLVVCAQTLEHVTDPLATVHDLLRVTRPGGAIYVEVPNEIWRNARSPRSVKNALLRAASKSRWLFIAMDIYSTGFRIKTGVLPPLGLMPMREHLNYFTTGALAALIRRAGGEIAFAGFNLTGEIVAVARKPR